MSEHTAIVLPTDKDELRLHWTDVINRLKKMPEYWPMESYAQRNHLSAICPKLQSALGELNVTRKLTPNVFPLDLVYSLYMLWDQSLARCISTLQDITSYIEGIDIILKLTNVKCQHYTMSGDRVGYYRNKGANKAGLLFFYQINDMSTTVIHCEVWGAINTEDDMFDSTWTNKLRQRLDWLQLEKLRSLQRLQSISVLTSSKSDSSNCTPILPNATMTDVAANVTHATQKTLSIGPHVTLRVTKCKPVNVPWAVYVAPQSAVSDKKRKLTCQIVGQGTFGTVYALSKDIVCKQVTSLEIRRLPDTVQAQDAFEEAAIGIVLSNCPYITKTLFANMGQDCSSDLLKAYIFMERGCLPLNVIFADLNTNNALRWIMPVIEHDTLQGLAYMHSQGFVHRDLKSNNMLLFLYGTSVVVKLCDLGCAQLGFSESIRCGDLYRAAPEVIIYPLYSTASDMFSWAMVMWAMYTDLVPFYDTTGYTSVTKNLFKCVGCYKNMASYGNGSDAAQVFKDTTVTTLDSRREFAKIRDAVYQTYKGSEVPDDLVAILVTNMSIFPQRRLKANQILGQLRYKRIAALLPVRDMTNPQATLQETGSLAGLLNDRNSIATRMLLTTRSKDKNSKYRVKWSYGSKQMYGHDHTNVKLTTDTEDVMLRKRNPVKVMEYNIRGASNDLYIINMLRSGDSQVGQQKRKRQNDSGSSGSTRVETQRVRQRSPATEGELESSRGLSSGEQAIDNVVLVPQANQPALAIIVDIPNSTGYVPQEANTFAAQEVGGSLDRGNTSQQAGTSFNVSVVGHSESFVPQHANASVAQEVGGSLDRGNTSQQAGTSFDHPSRRFPANINLKPNYRIRTVRGDSNVRVVIHTTALIPGQAWLTWLRPYVEYIDNKNVCTIAVQPLRDTANNYIVKSFARGNTCGVLYVTHNIGGPLWKYMNLWASRGEACDLYVLTQLSALMKVMVQLRCVPNRSLTVSDIWWNKATRTCRLDLFSFCESDGGFLSSADFRHWGKDLLTFIADACGRQLRNTDDLNDIASDLQNVELLHHTTYMATMSPSTVLQDPLSEAPSWC